MAEERAQRRLSTILAADVVGYSRLMEADEESALRTLKGHREVIDRLIQRHEGRIFGTAGDSVMAEFGSAVEAVRAAIAIQEELKTRNAELPDKNKMMLRIGVNLGDIIVEGENLYGDGVNVAARIEGLCAPGEVFVSDMVQRQIEGKLSVSLEDEGEHTVKNMSRPVRIYKVLGETTAMTEPMSGGETLPLPDKPSIAVLPFENISGDSEQDYFSDGITEDLITALSRFRWFFVIARNSSFTYKGRAVDVKQVARDLGVHYVLEGSVRKGGNRIRITAQLVDARSGHHIWAERYDRELTDIFAVQDEITEAITSAVAPAFASAEERRASRRAPENLDAWALVMRGMALWQTYREDETLQARRFFEQAMTLDPNFAPPYVGYALTYGHGVRLGFFEREEYEKALQAARRAVALDNDDAWAHAALGVVHFSSMDQDAAVDAFEHAISLNANFVTAHYYLGRALSSRGDAVTALRHIEQAIRLSPRDPHIGHFFIGAARAYLFLGEYEKSAQLAKQGLRHQNLQWSAPATLASALGHLGREEEANQAVEEMQRLRPGITISFVRERLPIVDKDYMDRMCDGLRKASLPQ